MTSWWAIYIIVYLFALQSKKVFKATVDCVRIQFQEYINNQEKEHHFKYKSWVFKSKFRN